MLKILTEKDIPEVQRLIIENDTFQGKPVSIEYRQRMAIKSATNLSYFQHSQPYFGEFDENGKLISFVRFEIWHASESGVTNTCTLGIMFTTNSTKLEKVVGSRWSKTTINILAFAYEHLTKQGITTCYTMFPATSTWLNMGDVFPYNVKREEIMVIPAHNRTSGNALFDKYLLQYAAYPIDQKVVKLTKMDI